MVYKIKQKEDKIRIFGEEFVELNEEKCNIIYRNKIFPLQEYFLIEDIDEQDKKEHKFELYLNELEDIKDRSYMFCECDSLIEFSLFNYNQKESSSNDRNDFSNEDSKRLEGFYSNCSEKKLNVINSSLTIERLYELSSIFVKEKKPKKNTPIFKYMSFMFYGCSSLKSLPDICNWNIDDVSDMDSLFYGCSSLISLPDLTNWNTQNVSYMGKMFYECSSLISLPNISNWNTSKVEDMSKMFYGCSSLTSLPDISNWNVKNVFLMEFIFCGCSSLISLPDLSKWDIKNLENTSHMFSGCALYYCYLIYLNGKLIMQGVWMAFFMDVPH